MFFPDFEHRYQIEPLRLAFVQRAREQGRDDQNQPVERVSAQGGEPCRDVLRRARPGEALILASYCPFALAGPYREYGPVFILAEPGDTGAAAWPPGGAASYFLQSFVLRAYDDQERIAAALVSSPAAAEADLAALFGRDEVRFVLARFAAYGCYGCRIARRNN